MSDSPRYWCDTCEGAGKVDNTLGSAWEAHCGKDDPCPDCDGKGYWQRSSSASSIRSDRQEEVPHEKASVPASSPVAPQGEPVARLRGLAEWLRVRVKEHQCFSPATEDRLLRWADEVDSALAAPQGDGLLRQALEALDDLGDDAAAHMLPADVERCSRSECTATVYSVRVSTPAERTQPLFTREQVEAALRQYLPKDPA